MELNNEILIIGPPKSAKTTFLAQLYGRLLERNGKIIIHGAPKNIEGIKDAYNRLSEGLEPQTTPANANLEVEIPVKLDERQFVLRAKDYGGEQVRDITKLMEYDSTWAGRAKSHDRWIMFIRPAEIYHHYDISMKGFAEQESQDEAKPENLPENRLSDQAKFIELLQILLHARKSGIKDRLKSPKLIIALTCWDELNTNDSPTEVLQTKLPLLYQFIKSNWDEKSNLIMGVSAQEFPLKTEEARQRYLEELPESFGYLVFDDNEQERDLTMLIETSINQ